MAEKKRTLKGECSPVLSCTIPEELNQNLSLPWKTKLTPKEKITLINGEDIKINPLLESLGLHRSPLRNSFGLSSKAKAELKARQELCKWIMDNNRGIETLCRWILFNEGSRIPSGYEDFLHEYSSSESSYWSRVDRVKRILKNCKGSTPQRIVNFNMWLNSTDSIREAEAEMAKVAKEIILGIVEMEGVMVLDIIGPSRSPKTYIKDIISWGYHKFNKDFCPSRDLLEPPKWMNSRWIDNRFSGWIKRLVEKVQNIENERLTKNALRPQVFNETPECLQDQIKVHVTEQMLSIDWGMVERELKKRGFEEDVSTATVTVHYTYTLQDGLKVKIKLVDLPDSYPKNLSLELSGYKGFGDETIEEIRRAKEMIADKMDAGSNQSVTVHVVSGILASQKPEFFNQKKVESFKMDEEYKRHALKTLWEAGQMKAVKKACELHRKKFYEIMENISNVQAILANLKKIASGSKFPLEMPNLILSGSYPKVAFNEIFPIHLLSQIKGSNLKPINGLPEIQQSLIGFTGKHGEGKTTILEAILAYVYLAQSGLPVFGKKVEMVPFDTVGAVFLERGAGSTCQLYLKKVGNLFKELQKTGGKAIVAIDELGTGTQESSGLDLGRRVLNTLEEMKASVVFSTQITTLAKEMEEKGIQIFQMNENHQILPGIGDGKLGELIENSELAEFLIK